MVLGRPTAGQRVAEHHHMAPPPLFSLHCLPQYSHCHMGAMMSNVHSVACKCCPLHSIMSIQFPVIGYLVQPACMSTHSYMYLPSYLAVQCPTAGDSSAEHHHMATPPLFTLPSLPEHSVTQSHTLLDVACLFRHILCTCSHLFNSSPSLSLSLSRARAHVRVCCQHGPIRFCTSQAPWRLLTESSER
jgi:hypothetical protein